LTLSTEYANLPSSSNQERGAEMIEYILSDIICREFEKIGGKGQRNEKSPKMMHVGFDFNTKDEDQYEVHHMYIYAPDNYVYVAVQEERIDENGKRIVGEMKILSYHDSCWRDAIRDFIFANRNNICVLKGIDTFFDWYDVLDIRLEEAEYLSDLNSFRHDCDNKDKEYTEPNPFDERGIWAGKM